MSIRVSKLGGMRLDGAANLKTRSEVFGRVVAHLVVQSFADYDCGFLRVSLW